VPLSRGQVENFIGHIAELFSVRPPRISRRLGRCRWRQKTLHLGRTITRERLAHQLAHYVARELRWPHDPNAINVYVGSEFVGRGKRLHGSSFRSWERLIGNYIAQEFGEGEGVTL
jgi:hypothetical protein